MPIISAQQLGQRRPLCADYALPLPDSLGAAGTTTLADLLVAVVRAEVSAFAQRQFGAQLLGVLGDTQIASGLQRGKISSGGSDLQQAVDPDAAIANALLAFADGLYLVIVDGSQVPALDTLVQFNADSRIVFLRLTALVGA